MTTEAGINAMNGGTLWPRERSGSAPLQRESSRGFDSAWQREMERMQAGSWFPGALPALSPGMVNGGAEALLPARESPASLSSLRTQRHDAPEAQARYPSVIAEQGRARGTAEAQSSWREVPQREAAGDANTETDSMAIDESTPVTTLPAARLVYDGAWGVTSAEGRAPGAHAAPAESREPGPGPVAAASAHGVAAQGLASLLSSANGRSQAALKSTDVQRVFGAVSSPPSASLQPAVSERMSSPAAPTGQGSGAALHPTALVPVALLTPAAPALAPAASAVPMVAAASPSVSMPSASQASSLADADSVPTASAPPAPRALPGAERALAAALSRDAAPRLHMAWDGSAVIVWLGIDGAPDAAALLRTVQRVLRQHGLDLSALVCNGRTLVNHRNVIPSTETSNRPLKYQSTPPIASARMVGLIEER